VLIEIKIPAIPIPPDETPAASAPAATLAAALPPRHRVNQIHPPPHQLRKRRLRTFPGIAPQQFSIFDHGVFALIAGAEIKTGQNNSTPPPA